MMHSKLAAAVATIVVLGCCTAPEESLDIQGEGAGNVHTAQHRAGKAEEAPHQAHAEEEAKVRNETAQESLVTQARANETIRDANEQAEQALGDLRKWSQKKIDHIDDAIDDARAMSASASASQKSEYERALRDVQVRRALVKRELSKLEAQSASHMFKLEERLRADVDELTIRVDKMRTAL